MPRPDQPLIRRLQPLVWLVLLLTGLGLSRMTVLCTQPCCAGHVKLVASCAAGATGPAAPTDSCCRPTVPLDREDHAPDERRPTAHTEDDGGCGCHHVRLGVELAPPPRIEPGHTNQLAGLPARLHPPLALPSEAVDPASHPPATGPPPHALRSAHRATIQLLL